MIFKYISPVAFIISLSVGLMFVYLSAPTPNVIYVYPTPDNSHHLQYKDKTNNCFEFSPNEVNCKEQSIVKTIPMQN